MTLNFTVAELLSKTNWALAAVATFAFYQFVEPCSSRDLIVFGAIEFIIIILILLVVTTLIVRTANKEGPEALYPPSREEESKYSRKWGSLYSKLKPPLYWFFILDYIFVLSRSIIIGAGQVIPVYVSHWATVNFVIQYSALEFLKSVL